MGKKCGSDEKNVVSMGRYVCTTVAKHSVAQTVKCARDR